VALLARLAEQPDGTRAMAATSQLMTFGTRRFLDLSLAVPLSFLDPLLAVVLCAPVTGRGRTRTRARNAYCCCAELGADKVGQEPDPVSVLRRNRREYLYLYY
jgi:hypothetical protein